VLRDRAFASCPPAHHVHVIHGGEIREAVFRRYREALSLTHFLRCLRASLIRGADATTVLGLAWPVALFALLVLLAATWGAYTRIEKSVPSVRSPKKRVGRRSSCKQRAS